MSELRTQLSSINQTLLTMNTKLEKVVSERIWYKTAAGFVTAASIAIISFIVFLISYSDEISSLKEILQKLIELNK